MLPNFLICGAQKAGTNSLYYYLEQHPEISLSEKKEVHFFCWDFIYNKGIRWYEKHFISDSKVIGEATPYYMFHPKVPKRIYETLPNSKLIFILRNPVSRAYSHYWHEVSSGWEDKSFEEAISIEDSRIKKSQLHHLHYSYLNRGKYAKQIQRFLDYFPKSQIMIIKTNDLYEKRNETLKKIFDFLKINNNINIKNFELQNVGMVPKIRILQKFAVKNNPFIVPFPYNKIKTKSKISEFIGESLKYSICKINLKRGYTKIKKETKLILNSYFEDYEEELSLLLKKW